MNRLIRERLVSQLDGLAVIANRELGLDSTRADDVGDDIDRIMQEIEIQFVEEISDEALEELARRRGEQVANQNARVFARELKRAKGLDVFAEDPALDRKLQAFGKRNSRLVTKMSREHRDRIASLATNGLSQGRSTRTIAREIQEASKIPRRRAALIARDQVASLNGQINRARQTANGITHFVWNTVGDDRVRDSHDDIDGQTFSWAEGAPGGIRPGSEINCRCSATPVLD